MRHQDVQVRSVGDAVDLVQHQYRRLLVAPQFRQHRVHRLDVLFGRGLLASTTCNQEPSLPGLFECRLERGDQMVRQLADETDRVGEQNLAQVRDVPLPGARVERGEEFVLDVDVRLPVSAFISRLLPAFV